MIEEANLPYRAEYDFAEYDGDYHVLTGPDNFICALTEPEDRTWWRDGRDAVDRLNEQHAKIEALKQRVAELEDEKQQEQE